MRSVIIKLLRAIPYVGRLVSFEEKYKSMVAFPPGHYYTPIVDPKEIENRKHKIWGTDIPEDIPGIELNVKGQLELLQNIRTYYNEAPFFDSQSDGLRYFYKNGLYSYTDALYLFGMMRHLQPNRIIEVGSGFSSALMLDTNERFFSNKISLTFIEPYPERLNSLLKIDDRSSVRVIEQFVQDVDVSEFEGLEPGDILFIDSTHVLKTGSDVNYLYLEVLPRLKPGVFIHIHDIFHPFEYPKDWVMKGWNWNENYILRAFLMYNKKFEICLFSDYLAKYRNEDFGKMPKCKLNSGGNIWLRKLS